MARTVKSVFMQEPVELHSSRHHPSCSSLLTALPLVKQVFFFFCQESTSTEFMFVIFLSVFSTGKAQFKNGLCRNCSKFPFILIEAICLQMKMSLT